MIIEHLHLPPCAIVTFYVPVKTPLREIDIMSEAMLGIVNTDNGQSRFFVVVCDQ